MKIVEYDMTKREALTGLLESLSKDLYERGRPVSVDNFIDSHTFTYLVYDGDIPVGFTSYVVSDNSGLSEDILVNDFAYVLPKYRGSKAFMLMMAQTGKIVKELEMKVQIPIVSDMLKGTAEKFKAKEVYNVFEYSVGDSIKEFNRLCKILYKG